MIVFLAILEDRHIDVQVEAFRSPEAAAGQCLDWENAYHEHWNEPLATEYRSDPLTAGMTRAGWLYYRDLGDDAPTMRVERKEVHE